MLILFLIQRSFLILFFFYLYIYFTNLLYLYSLYLLTFAYFTYYTYLLYLYLLYWLTLTYFSYLLYLLLLYFTFLSFLILFFISTVLFWCGQLPMEPPPPPPSPPSPQPQPPSVNIWGPEFQPVVLLQRLTVEEVKTLTRSEAVQTPPRKTRRARSPARPPPTVRPEAAGLVDRKQTKKTTARPQRPLFRRKATVRETQQLLRQAHHRPVGPPVDEDQAAFTEGAFLNSSLSAGIKRLATVSCSSLFYI